MHVMGATMCHGSKEQNSREKHLMRRRDFITAAIGTAAAWPVSSRAETYPSRPITLIVPFAAGGPTDVLARILAEQMRMKLGQAVVIENVTGASGTIAGMRAARATPDGYTITIGHWGTHVLNGAVYSLQYDVLNDFDPVALIGNGPQLIIGRPTLPARDLKELIGWLKDNPNKATAGTAGPGSGAHVAGVFFQNLTGDPLFLRALSRRRPCAQRPDGRAHRSDVRPGHQFAAAGARRQCEGLCRDFAVAARLRARYPDGG